MHITLPEAVGAILQTLNRNGCEAYAVGGCVRDSLLGIKPYDWDICTSALPEEILRYFSDYKTLDVGIKHGTVAVLIDGVPYEVTTFRVDGTYSNSRHPDEVRFVRNLREDLARRDFTINAIAYHPETGIADPFGGLKDLQNGLIRCVGDPALRFEEDALRLMRALRIAAVYGYEIEDETKRAIHAGKHRIVQIARERVRVELVKLLLGKACDRVLEEYWDVLNEVIPEISPMVGFDQHNPHHVYDVWRHTIHAVKAAPPDEVLRLTMLLHDVGKPGCFFTDQKGIGHFYGHDRAGEKMSEQILRRLRFDRKTTETVSRLIRYHGVPVASSPKSLRRWLNRLGEQDLRLLLQVKRSDRIGKGTPLTDHALEDLDRAEQVIDAILKEQQCFRLKDLAINGTDLIAAGFQEGLQIRELLQEVLNQVIDGKLENNRAELLSYIKRKM